MLSIVDTLSFMCCVRVLASSNNYQFILVIYDMIYEQYYLFKYRDGFKFFAETFKIQCVIVQHCSTV